MSDTHECKHLSMSNRENAHRPYKDAIAGPKTMFQRSCDGKRVVITQDGNTVELCSTQIKELPRLADRWIRK